MARYDRSVFCYMLWDEAVVAAVAFCLFFFLFLLSLSLITREEEGRDSDYATMGCRIRREEQGA